MQSRRITEVAFEPSWTRAAQHSWPEDFIAHRRGVVGHTPGIRPLRSEGGYHGAV